MPGTDSEMPNRGIFIAVTVLGVVLVCFAVVSEAYWGWAGVWPSILVNLGTTLVLAYALVVLERRFTRTAKREAAAAVEETRDEFTELGRRLGTRIDELADQMTSLAAAEDAGIANGLARLRNEPTYDHIVEMFETARNLNALDGSLVTVPTSPALSGPHLSFRWEPGEVRTRYNEIEFSGPRELHVTHDGYFSGRGSRRVVNELWSADKTPAEIGMAVRNAIISAGEWIGEDAFDWTHSLRMLATALELAILSRRKAEGAVHLRGALSEVLDHRFVMTTAGVEVLDGRLLISVEEIPFHVVLTPAERAAWRPTSLRPDDVSIKEWAWLSSRALEKYEHRSRRMPF